MHLNSVESGGVQMVLEVSGNLLQDIDNQLEDGEAQVFKRMELWHLNMLVSAIESDLIPLADREKYMLIKLPNERIPKVTLTILYSLQLLGYVPIIVDVETNLYFKNSLKTIQAVVNKGALIQVKASSVIGNRGKAIQKYTMKLCKKKLVHFIDIDTHHSNKKRSPKKNVYKYLQKKISSEYVQFLLENEKHVFNGTDFHVPNPKVRKLK